MTYPTPHLREMLTLWDVVFGLLLLGDVDESCYSGIDTIGRSIPFRLWLRRRRNQKRSILRIGKIITHGSLVTILPTHNLPSRLVRKRTTRHQGDRNLDLQ